MTGDKVVFASVIAILVLALETNQLALGARPLDPDQKASDPPPAYNAPSVAPDQLYYNSNVSKRGIPYSGPSQCSSSIPGVLCPPIHAAAAAAIQREISINVTIIPGTSEKVESTYTEDNRGVSGQSRKPGRKVKISNLE